jgi:TRAP-type C4-dicarboxylate transport system permease small subunit
MVILEKINRILNLSFICIAGLCLAAMIVMTCANILLRIIWVPLKGTYELMGFFGAIVTAFSLGYTQLKKAHISVDIVVERFPPGIQKILNGLGCIICIIFFSIAGWQISKYAATLLKTGEVTETLRIAYYPFTFGVAGGCLLLAIVMLIEFLKLFFQKRQGDS